MIKTTLFLNDKDIAAKYFQLEQLNRTIDISKLERLSSLKDEQLQEFISTNNIEGDITTYAQAIQFLKNLENESKDSLERRWIGIKRAHEIIWSDKFTFSEDGVKEVHRALMRSTTVVGGIYKQKMNKVGSLYTSLPQDVPVDIKSLFLDFNILIINEGANIFNITQLISSFLAIHPFEDGNGRTSRLLFNRLMFDAGYRFAKYISLSKFIWDEKDRYISAFVSRNNAWAAKTLDVEVLKPIIMFMLEVAIQGAKKALEYTNLKKYSFEEFKDQFLTLLNIEELSFSQLSSKLKWANSDRQIMEWIKLLIINKQIIRVGKNKGSKYRRS